LQIYKHRNEDPLALILTSSSFTQAYARMKYLKLIAQQDKKDARLLRSKKEKIQQQKYQIEEQLSIQKNLIEQRKKEKTGLDGEMVKRKQVLIKIRKDKNSLKLMLDERREDMEAMKALIVALEKKKKEQEAANLAAAALKKETSGKSEFVQPVYKEASTFGATKGRLPYPAAGKIVKPFGDQINQTLGTRTRNTGVDIQTAVNAPVHAVAKGQVSVVTWLRRFGNTVLIDHGGGYYTVYAHLSEVYVSPDQTLQAGETIARVDESDEGLPTLHFEIYKDREAQNPAVWLQ